MIYSQWLFEWLETTIKPLKKMRTYEKYSEIAERLLIPELGSMQIEALSSSVLQTFTAKMTQRYAANTVNGIITVLKNSLRRAEKAGIVERQFSGSIEYPKSRERQVECFTVAEQRKIEEYIIQSKNFKLYGVLLCLYTGLRIGELLALGWGDIDLARGYITVTKTCHDSWKNGTYIKILDTPKTYSSRRIIPIPRAVTPFLRELKNRNLSPWIICGRDGGELSIRSYQRTFELLLKRLKIPHRGFHSLRHTFATRAIECGMDVKTLSEILGHNNPAITLRRYVHSLMDHKCAMMNKLGKSLRDK